MIDLAKLESRVHSNNVEKQINGTRLQPHQPYPQNQQQPQQLHPQQVLQSQMWSPQQHSLQQYQQQL